MAIQNEVSRAIKDLSLNKTTTVNLSGIVVSIQVFEEGSKLALATSVYEGGNYVPLSVRRSLTEKAPFRPSFIKTFLKLDEGHFQVTLHYLGNHSSLKGSDLQELLMEFSYLAEEWRHYLDEHDKNDLVHIRAAR